MHESHHYYTQKKSPLLKKFKKFARPHLVMTFHDLNLSWSHLGIAIKLVHCHVVNEEVSKLVNLVAGETLPIAPLQYHRLIHN